MQRIFKSNNAKGLGKGCDTSVTAGGSKYETFYFPGAVTIEVKVSGNGYASTNISYLRSWMGTYEDEPQSYLQKNYFSSSSSQSDSTITTVSHTGDTITFEWTQNGTNSRHYYFVQLTPYDADGNIVQEEVEGKIPIELDNVYKPSQMSTVIQDELAVPLRFEKLQKLTISNLQSASYYGSIDLSDYITDASQVKFAIWNGAGTSITSNGEVLIYFPDLFGVQLLGTNTVNSSYKGYNVPGQALVPGYPGYTPPSYQLLIDGLTFKLQSGDNSTVLSMMLGGRGTFTCWYKEV